MTPDRNRSLQMRSTKGETEMDEKELDEKELKPEELESVDGGTNKFGPIQAGRPVARAPMEREEGKQLAPGHYQR